MLDKSVFAFERQAKIQGFQWIAGVDEAGRGPLAGPVVAAACVLKGEVDTSGIDDSKALSARQREKAFEFLTHTENVIFAVGIIQAEAIDRLNILQATFKAMQCAVENLQIPPDYVLVDGSILPKWPYTSQAIIKGDSLSLSISAASIIAKFTRDRIMDELDHKYPGYGFAKHKGYGTKAHLEALASLGPCPEHRKSFEPIKSVYLKMHGK